MNNTHNRDAELDALGLKGRQAIESCKASRATMFDGIIAYGIVLFEGRLKFISNNDFHDWVVKNKLDAPPFAHPVERSNAKKLAKLVLSSVPKTAFADCPYTAPSNIMRWARETGIVATTKSKQEGRNSAEVTAETIKAVTGKWPTSKELAHEAGIAPRNADNALRVVKALEEVRDVPKIQFTKAQEHHIEAEIKRRQAQLDAKFADVVNKKIEDLIENTIGPQYRAQLADAEKVIKARRGAMSRDKYKLILACLHPDNSASIERKTEAFRVFLDLELVMVSEKELPYEPKVTDVPRSMNEWMARRAKVDAERKAARDSRKK